MCVCACIIKSHVWVWFIHRQREKWSRYCHFDLSPLTPEQQLTLSLNTAISQVTFVQNRIENAELFPAHTLYLKKHTVVKTKDKRTWTRCAFEPHLLQRPNWACGLESALFPACVWSYVAFIRLPWVHAVDLWGEELRLCYSVWLREEKNEGQAMRAMRWYRSTKNKS